MSTTWIEEFLYRGRPSGDPREPAWHGKIGAKSVDGFGNERVDISEALTAAQMEAAGYPLSGVLSGIDTATLIEVEALRETRDALKSRNEVLEDALTASMQRETEVANQAAAAAQAAAEEIAALQARIVDLTAPPATEAA